MKKLLALILVVCLAFAGFLTWNNRESISLYSQIQPSQEVPAAPAPAQDVPAAPTYKGLDVAKLYALHSPDEVVATVDGNDVTWGEFFYWYSVQARQMDSYFQQYAMYLGQNISWNDVADPDTGMTYSDLAFDAAENMIRQMYGIEKMSNDLGLGFDEADQAELDASIQSDIDSLVGEGGTREDLSSFLAEAYLPEALYERVGRTGVLYAKGYDVLFGGEEATLVSDEDAVAFLSEQGYMNAHHILFLTTAPADGSVDQAAFEAEKLAAAEALVEELRAIEDDAGRLARFEELKVEKCEDTGKTDYPHGYCFTPGTMVPEFEEAAKALAPYEISEPVKTTYGYHVLMGLPLDADAPLYSSDGTDASARQLFAAEEYDALIVGAMDALELIWAEGFGPIDLSAYISE